MGVDEEDISDLLDNPPESDMVESSVAWNGWGAVCLFNYATVWLLELTKPNNEYKQYEHYVPKLERLREDIYRSNVYDTKELRRRVRNHRDAFVVASRIKGVGERFFSSLGREKQEAILEKIFHRYLALNDEICEARQHNLHFWDDDEKVPGLCCHGKDVYLNHAHAKTYKKYLSILSHELYHVYDMNGPMSNLQTQIFNSIEDEDLYEDSRAIWGDVIPPTEIGAYWAGHLVEKEKNKIGLHKVFFTNDWRYAKKVQYMNHHLHQFSDLIDDLTVLSDEFFEDVPPTKRGVKFFIRTLDTDGEDVDISNSSFIDVYFSNRVKNSSFSGGNFENCTFVEAKYFDCDFSDSYFVNTFDEVNTLLVYDTLFKGCNFSGCDFNLELDIQGGKFIDCDLTSIDFRRVKEISMGSVFKGCKLNATEANIEFVEQNPDYFKDVKWERKYPTIKNKPPVNDIDQIVLA